jgi:putative ABC transport system substrate-binding protein
MLDSSEVASAAGTLGLTAVTAEIRGSGDISPAFDVFKDDIQSLYICSDFLTYTLRIGINTFAHVARLPPIYGEREQPEAGGLMSYGPNFPNLFRRAADFVDKILRGTKPADLPVEQPTKFDLVINLTTAKALGLKIPEAFLLRADALIE